MLTSVNAIPSYTLIYPVFSSYPAMGMGGRVSSSTPIACKLWRKEGLVMMDWSTALILELITAYLMLLVP